MAVQITLQQLRNAIPLAPPPILTEILQSVNDFRNEHNIADISKNEIIRNVVGVFHNDMVGGQASLWIQTHLNTGPTAGVTSGGGRCCFNSKFCKGTDHYKKDKPEGYVKATQAEINAKRRATRMRGGKKDSENEDAKEGIRNILAGLTKEEKIAHLQGVLSDLEKRRLKRKKRNPDAEPSIMPSLPPPPPPPSAPMISVGGARTAKTAQQHAMQAIAQIQALLGVVADANVTPREALKDLGKAKYKQTKYEKEVAKDKAVLASTGVERVKKAESAWIAHVKAYALANGVSYKQALKDASPSYRAR